MIKVTCRKENLLDFFCEEYNIFPKRGKSRNMVDSKLVFHLGIIHKKRKKEGKKCIADVKSFISFTMTRNGNGIFIVVSVVKASKC